jgi:hypothetical protein
VTDNDLPEPARRFLAELAARDGVRPVLIKRRGERGKAVYYAHLPTRRVHRFDLADLADLPDLPWEALFAGQTDAGLSTERPLWVCTHSNRDACCGLWGAPTGRALEAIAPGRVWQCTHLGGHRFAATLVALPEGIHFGRVLPEEAGALITELDAGQWYDLDRVRGSLRVPPPAQAAELAVRRQTGERRIDAVVARAWEVDAGITRVWVDTPNGRILVLVERVRGPGVAPPSCGEAAAPVPGWRCTVAGGEPGIASLSDAGAIQSP